MDKMNSIFINCVTKNCETGISVPSGMTGEAIFTEFKGENLTYGLKIQEPHTPLLDQRFGLPSHTPPELLMEGICALFTSRKLTHPQRIEEFRKTNFAKGLHKNDISKIANRIIIWIDKNH